MNQQQSKAAVVIGASGGIAQALIRRLLSEDTDRQVIAISRSRQPDETADSRLHWLQSDNSDQSMVAIVEQLASHDYLIDRLFICNGVLHQNDIAPEKRLKAIDRESLNAVFNVNAFIPILWIKHLAPLLTRHGESVITVFSARVGSIEDNRVGGWYSYRASKAALNMLLKTAAIEIRRFSESTRLLAFHPGTTDTALSRPYQQGVPADKLFTPDFVAERLLNIVDSLPSEPMLNFMDWDGKEVSW